MAKAKRKAQKKIKVQAKTAAADIKRRKVKAQTEQKAKHTASLTKLKPVAKEVNARLDKANVADGKADDHRLAASLVLAKAKETCEKDGIKFKKWCEDSITQSYHTLRQLAAVGGSDNPAEALADLRAGAKNRNKAMRERKSVEATPPKAITAKSTPFQAATQALNALEDKPVLNLIESAAQSRGMRVVSETDHKELKFLRKQAASGPGLKVVLAGFDSLKASEQMILAEHAATKVGCKLIKPDFDKDPLELPEFMDRKVKRGAKK